MEDFEQLDYYALLGVERSASADAIKRAYRQQIARYHPDRYVSASPAEQSYASQRAQRINEAYRVLSDFTARNAYNRGLPATAPSRPFASAAPVAPSPPPARDYQAELYAEACGHLDAGRYMQAAATLRQLQQINPFYRDSASLLNRAETALRDQQPARRRPSASADDQPDRTRRMLIVGGMGGVAVAGLVAAGLWLRRSSPPETVGLAPTDPTAVPASPTPAPANPTPAPASPTPAPASPTPAPASPTPAPASPTPAPVAERGVLLLAEDFSGPTWASVQGGTWSVGAVDGRYRISVQSGSGNIWSYNTAPGAEFSVGVNVQVQGGAAGLLLHYNDRSNYLAFFIDPQERAYRLERRGGGQVATLAEGVSQAITTSVDRDNRLVARLQGNNVQLFINGFLVSDVTVENLARSQLYGMIAVARSDSAVALFDDLELRTLE